MEALARLQALKKTKDELDVIYVELRTGETVDVRPYTWGMPEFHSL